MFTLLLTVFFTSSAAAPADTLPATRKPTYGHFGFDTSGMDAATKPGNDFFRYANGGWLDRTAIPANRSYQATYSLLGDRARAQTRALLEQQAATPGSRVGDFYASYLDQAAADRQGLTPVQPWLRAIAQCRTKRDLVLLMAGAQRRGVAGLFYAGVYPNPSAPSQYLVHLGQDGLGLPSRGSYLDTTSNAQQARQAYQRYLVTLFTLAHEPRAAQRAQAVFAFEAQLAQGHWTPLQDRDATATTNLYPTATWSARDPRFPWTTYLAALGVAGQRSLLIQEPSAFQAETRAWQTTALAVLRDWLWLRTLDQFAPYLSEPFVAAHFQFHRVALEGVTARVPRWETGHNLLARYLPDEVGRLYTAKYFPASSKRGVEQMVAAIRAAMERRLVQEDWLSSETKARAVAKLRNLKVVVGYPDAWQSYAGLLIRRQDLVGNVARVRAFRYAAELSKLGQPVNRAAFPYSASVTIAWATPGLNEIAFSAAYLQPPLYDPLADAAVNYGAIGTIIGHEISHNFDDQGRKYDAQGTLHPWWQPSEVNTFEQRATRLATQYGAYEPLPGSHLDGQLTLGENLADLTGLTISYDAYRATQPQSLAQTLDGFTPAQRFFLGYAQANRGKTREALLRRSLQTDPHAPEEQRVNEVRNLASWYEAFGVTAESRLYLPVQERVVVW